MNNLMVHHVLSSTDSSNNKNLGHICVLMQFNHDESDQYPDAVSKVVFGHLPKPSEIYHFHKKIHHTLTWSSRVGISWVWSTQVDCGPWSEDVAVFPSFFYVLFEVSH